MESYVHSHAPQGSGTVLNRLHGDSVSQIEHNRQHVKVLLDVVLLCAKMEVSLRGHRETEDVTNRGNFCLLFEHTAKYAPEIKERLQELPQNATFMSHHIQDELLEAAKTLLHQKIKSELHEQSTYYAILGDKYKDTSKRELVAICVRFVHGGVIKERAVGFVETATNANEKVCFFTHCFL